MKQQSVIDLIGNTPIVELPQAIHKTENRIFAKLEYCNPTKSMKDRVAFGIIDDAKKRGLIGGETTIVEASSGNMGISLAFVCAMLGHKLIICMSEAMSIERRKLINYYGAEFILTSKELGFSGTIAKAKELALNTPNSFFVNQYDNNVNFDIHFKNTGPEIYNQMNGDVDVFVTGAGTGAFISGVSSFVKSKRDLYTICVEPEGCDILEGGTNFKPHELQGIGPNFLPQNFKRDKIDRIIHISNDDAFFYGKLLGSSYGITSGVSGGANFAAVLKYAKEVSGKNILFLVCDHSERYVSSNYFA